MKIYLPLYSEKACQTFFEVKSKSCYNYARVILRLVEKALDNVISKLGNAGFFNWTIFN